MSLAVTESVVAGASAIGGGVIVAASNYVVSRGQGRAASKAELRRSLSSLLSTLQQINLQLKSEPDSKPTVRAVNERMASRFPQIDYVTGRIHQRLFQPGFDDLMRRFNDAMAATLLVAPSELLNPIQEINELMSNVEPHSAEWQTEFHARCGRLIAACRQTLGLSTNP